jgi:hypothetical protein
MAKPTVKTRVVKDSNLFEIKTDMMFSGNRVSRYKDLLPSLREQVLKLKPENKNVSVHIPLSVCPHKNAASNIVLYLRRQLKAEKATEKIYLACKTLYDDKKTYIGTRVWRLA